MAFPTSGCIAYYRLDDASGTSAADATGSGNTGTLTNSPTWTTGQINGALSFATASTQYVDLGTGINPAAISYTAWIKATSFPNSYNCVLARSDAGVNYTAMLIKSTGKLAFYVGNSAPTHVSSYDGVGSNTLSTGTWYFIALTFDSTSGLKGYVNASLDSSSGSAFATDTSAISTYIGGQPATAGRYFNGIIDEVGIWNRALTSTEVSDLYNSGTGLSYPGGGGGSIILPPYLFDTRAV